MAYYNEDQLRRYFEKAIKRESDEKVRKLQKEIDYLYQKEIKKINEEIEIKKQVQMAKELREVQINYQEELNQIGTGYDEKLILKRSEMTQEIFHEIEKKIESFAQTEVYNEWLKKRLNTYSKKVNGHDFEVRIAFKDQVAEKQIQDSFNKQSFQLIKDKDIRFGGFILTIPKINIELNETLDAQLNEQKEWFLNHSKLFIRR